MIDEIDFLSESGNKNDYFFPILSLKSSAPRVHYYSSLLLFPSFFKNELSICFERKA